MKLLSVRSKFVVLATFTLLAVPRLSGIAQSLDKVFGFQTVDGPVNALRAYDTSTLGTTVPEALTAAYHASGDGGGNRFYWSSTSQLPDNGGTVIRPNAVPSPSPGRWLATDRSILNVKAFGAYGDGSRDDTAAINAAIAEAKNTGRHVYVPPGAFGITATIVIDGSTVGGNPVMIEGAADGSGIVGGPYTSEAGSSLKWIGALSTSTERPMVRFILCNKNGHGLRNIFLDNNNRNSHGLEIDRCNYGSYERVSIDNIRSGNAGWGGKFWCSSSSTSCCWNLFNELYINAQTGGSPNGVGLWLTGDPNGVVDFCQGTFRRLNIIYASPQIGLLMEFTDNNTFINTSIDDVIWPLGTNQSVYCHFDNPSGGNMPHHNSFFYITHSGWTNSVGAIAGRGVNTVYSQDTGSGITDSVINSGRLNWTSDDGAMHGFTGDMRNIGSDNIIDWTRGDMHFKSITSDNTTFSFQNVLSGKTIRVVIYSAGHSFSFPSSLPGSGIPVRWKGGSQPPSGGSGTWDVYDFTYADATPRAVLASGGSY